jgi:hypothetical protein
MQAIINPFITKSRNKVANISIFSENSVFCGASCHFFALFHPEQAARFSRFASANVRMKGETDLAHRCFRSPDSLAMA